jgi:hypothetical protein
MSIRYKFLDEEILNYYEFKNFPETLVFEVVGSRNRFLLQILGLTFAHFFQISQRFLEFWTNK